MFGERLPGLAVNVEKPSGFSVAEAATYFEL
jgi:hypothetical protein